jgi:hypothetical protein
MNDNIDDGGMLTPEPGGPEPEKKPPRAPRPTTAEAKPDATAPRAAAAQSDEDLSAEIARTVEREPGEQVTCRRVSKNHYRCNWWRPQAMGRFDNPSMGGLLVTTNRISRSHFLRVPPPAAGGDAKNRRLSITVVPER